jgi:hypothetical protein
LARARRERARSTTAAWLPNRSKDIKHGLLQRAGLAGCFWPISNTPLISFFVEGAGLKVRRSNMGIADARTTSIHDVPDDILEHKCIVVAISARNARTLIGCMPLWSPQCMLVCVI